VCLLRSRNTATSAKAVGDQPPNFVVILVDDLGWTDLTCQ